MSAPAISISPSPWAHRLKDFPLGLPEACLWLALFFLLTPYLGALLLGLGLQPPQRLPIETRVLAQSLLTLIFMAYFAGFRRGKPVDLGLGLARPHIEIAWGLAACAVMGLVYLAGLGAAWLGFLWWFGSADKLAAWVRSSPISHESSAYVLSVCLAIPVLEEIWFRGLMYPPMRLNLGRWPAIVLLSAIFAAAHDTSLPVTQFIGGLVFAWAYEKRQSLIAPIILHIAGNSVLVVIGWAMQQGILRL